MDWAKGNPTIKPDTGLHKFDFMFVVALRDIDSNVSLEDVIIQQHDLKTKHRIRIQTILDTPDILVAFDGYDEYTKGTNSDIDLTLAGKKRKFSFIVTSRPGDYLDKKDRRRLTEVQITGLSNKNIEKCDLLLWRSI